jgi:Fe-S oxidoreductase
LASPSTGDRPLCCGRTHLSQGQISKARREAERTLAALEPFLEKGWPIVGLEPSCLLMLRDEYHALLPAKDARRLAGKASLIEEFLFKEIEAGRLELPFKTMTGQKTWVHGHCHQKAFGTLKPLRKLLAKVPGLAVELIESSCCGMAGSFGFEQEHHAASMAMGEIGLLPSVRSAEHQDWIMANGTSCRHQIFDGAAREARHLVEILLDCLSEESPAD